MRSPITLYTSLCPAQSEEGKYAVASWQRGGYDIVSVNPPQEIAALRPVFPQVRFVEAKHEPPMFDELIAAIDRQQLFGIVNGDCALRLSAAELAPVIRDRLVFGHRTETAQLGDQTGELFTSGFDFFFMHGRLLYFLPASDFQLGRPAWDYYFPYSMQNAINTVLLQDHVTLHRRHVQRWSGKHYLDFVAKLSDKFGRHANSILPKIKQQARVMSWPELQRDQPRVEIFCVTFHRDLACTEYMLKSCQKHAHGFAGITLLVPDVDRHFFEPIGAAAGAKIKTYHEIAGKGMIHHELMICRADEYCPDVDNILHIDSDCMFTEPVSPEDYFVQGKPVLLIEAFEVMAKRGQMGEARCQWKSRVDRAIGGDCKFETMCRHPAVHGIWLYKMLRQEIEQFTHISVNDYVLAQQSNYPQGFAEFPALGAVVLRGAPELYHLIDVTSAPRPPDKLVQFWTHTPDYAAMEKVLNK